MTGPAIREGQQIFDIILSRPSLIFGTAAKLPKSVLQRAKLLEGLATSSKRELSEAARMEQFLLPHGATVPGGLIMDDVTKRLNIKPVVVGGQDLTHRAVRDLTGTVRMDWTTPGTLQVELPRRVTDEQVTHLSRFFDNNQIETVHLFDPTGKAFILQKPLGAQVEDAIYEATGKYATKKSRLTPDLVMQYQKTGVFKGQAGLLADGSPVEIRSKQGFMLDVFDPTNQRVVKVHQSKITILPTTLEDQFKPNNIFQQYLSEEEKVGIGKLRVALQSGLGQPIKKFGQLEQFAGTRGFIAERLTKGKVALVDMASGERQQFENLEAAVASVRSNTRPASDLTPESLKELFGGDTNVGFIGPNGRPPLIGEQIPVPTHIVVDNAMSRDKYPGAAEHIFRPMRSQFQDLQRRTGLPFGDMFLNIHARTVERQNFNARWIHGKGRPLPEGVTHLDEIMRIAGKGANEDAITELIEAGTDAAARTRIIATMTPGEVEAASRLRKWYDELFKEFGVTADYIENYVPHWRENAQKYGNDIYEVWRGTHGNAPIPKAATFFADYYRTGMMDIYDTKAFRMAQRYAHAGSSNRFMKEPLDQVANFLKQVKSPALTKPMSEYLEALRGTEFLEQHQMIERTLDAAFNRIPGLGGATAKGLASKLSDLAIGLGYTSTLAFRPAAVLRNYAQIFHTTYAVFGTADGAFVQGIGRATTRAGKLAAIEDGAISLKSAAVFGRQEMEETIPMFKKFADSGFKLYDTADEFTRATSYWVARENASRAIARYAKAADSANPARSKRALDKLLLDSKLYMFEENIQKEFLRRMVKDPELAARFVGKQMSDVTQFLYGRGMQPFWMRSTFGKFLGQYGTWSLWYIDYLTRTTQNLRRAGHTGEAIKFLARNAMVNGAILYAGHEVLEIDLGRWLAYPAIFYSGGPGAQIATGMMHLFRGLSDISAMSESEFAKSHFTEGVRTLAGAGLAYVPFRSAGRDAYRLTEAIQSGTYTEILASMLGTRPTNDYTVGQQLDAMYPGGPLAYEEWMRYAPGAVAGPSASSLTEMEYYRAKTQGSGPAQVPGQVPQQPGLAPGGTGRPPSPQQMGIPAAPAPGQGIGRRSSTTVGGRGMMVPRTAESEPLDR
jgi:hypothetical protein